MIDMFQLNINYFQVHGKHLRYQSGSSIVDCLLQVKYVMHLVYVAKYKKLKDIQFHLQPALNILKYGMNEECTILMTYVNSQSCRL